jgi:hypothetical protein
LANFFRPRNPAARNPALTRRNAPTRRDALFRRDVSTRRAALILRNVPTRRDALLRRTVSTRRVAPNVLDPTRADRASLPMKPPGLPGAGVAPDRRRRRDNRRRTHRRTRRQDLRARIIPWFRNPRIARCAQRA